MQASTKWDLFLVKNIHSFLEYFIICSVLDWFFCPIQMSYRTQLISYWYLTVSTFGLSYTAFSAYIYV